MADLAYRRELLSNRSGPNWGAVWAGAFAFMAIWAVFGSLGEAIFASAANPRSANTVGAGIGWGAGIWAIVLTMIAMYAGGRVTAHFSAAETRRDAGATGTTMFGLSVVSAIVLVTLAGAAVAGGTGVNAASKASVVSTLAGLGWAGFLSLFLGWLCAMWGTSAGMQPKLGRQELETSDNVRDIRAA